MKTNIKKTRESLGFSKTAMAKTMGVNLGTWNKWESGERRMTAAPLKFLKTLVWLQKRGLMVAWARGMNVGSKPKTGT